MNPNRIRLIKDGEKKSGPVIYWMSRDQRVNDNWALIFAHELAIKNSQPLIVVFNLVENFLGATIRQYGFMLKGLQEVEENLVRLNINFVFLIGEPDKTIPKFIKETEAGFLVTDFDPLKIKRDWKEKVKSKIKIPFYEVDAHNIVPCFYVSKKEEYGAYTIRPKIHKALPEFLDEFPKLKVMKNSLPKLNAKIDWIGLLKNLKIDFSVKEVEWIAPGESAAAEAFNNFLSKKIFKYDIERNDPTKSFQSNLSPYLHFGHLSAQRIALALEQFEIPHNVKESFLEELIVRRELADNFCYYNSNYDSFDGFQGWAKKTLNEHRKDVREFVYSLEEFENANTHEDLWNAAQNELIKTGKLHGYMRMYWAKKILEWSESPEEALRIAIYLNDKYELDGRDPNGYTGCAWAIGGVHDRAWKERPVFGKIRYMNRNGCKRKFDIDFYIRKFQ